MKQPIPIDAKLTDDQPAGSALTKPLDLLPHPGHTDHISSGKEHLKGPSLSAPSGLTKPTAPLSYGGFFDYSPGSEKGDDVVGPSVSSVRLANETKQ